MAFLLVTLGVVSLLFVFEARSITTVSDQETEPAGPPIDAMSLRRHPPYILNARNAGVDLYGNKVNSAVADYRVDRLGNLYERHEPYTPVVKLAPPGT